MSGSWGVVCLCSSMAGVVFEFKPPQCLVLGERLQPQWIGRRSTRRRTGSLCFVAGFYRQRFTLPVGADREPLVEMIPGLIVALEV